MGKSFAPVCDCFSLIRPSKVRHRNPGRSRRGRLPAHDGAHPGAEVHPHQRPASLFGVHTGGVRGAVERCSPSGYVCSMRMCMCVLRFCTSTVGRFCLFMSVCPFVVVFVVAVAVIAVQTTIGDRSGYRSPYSQQKKAAVAYELVVLAHPEGSTSAPLVRQSRVLLLFSF